MASLAVGTRVYRSYPTERKRTIRAQAKRMARAELWQRLQFMLILVGGGSVGFGVTGLIVMYLHYHPLSTLFN
jgi:hypothetical protein